MYELVFTIFVRCLKGPDCNLTRKRWEHFQKWQIEMQSRNVNLYWSCVQRTFFAISLATIFSKFPICSTSAWCCQRSFCGRPLSLWIYSSKDKYLTDKRLLLIIRYLGCTVYRNWESCSASQILAKIKPYWSVIVVHCTCSKTIFDSTVLYLCNIMHTASWLLRLATRFTTRFT